MTLNGACYVRRARRNIRMSLQTFIARRLFPKDQTFMAKRKLRVILLALLVGLLAAAAVLGVLLVAQRTQ